MVVNGVEPGTPMPSDPSSGTSWYVRLMIIHLICLNIFCIINFLYMPFNLLCCTLYMQEIMACGDTFLSSYTLLEEQMVAIAKVQR